MRKLAATLELRLFEKVVADIEANFSSIFQKYDIAFEERP